MIELALETPADSGYYSIEGAIKFSPPVYEQRYCAVAKILELDFLKKHKINKVAEFGCADMKFLSILKRVEGVEHVLQIDTDEETLRNYEQRAKPYVIDYIKKRLRPFRVDIIRGSIAVPNSITKNSDAVIGIEVIEHLDADVLDLVPSNIFGYIHPKIAIFTTPNSEFNVYFNLKGPFRHNDHRFEWTRKEFIDWALNICASYPNYEVAFTGVGSSPPNKPLVGPVTQIAIFIRKDIRHGNLLEELNKHEEKAFDITYVDRPYKLLHTIHYPIEERTPDEVLYDEIKFHLIRLLRIKDPYFVFSKRTYEIPLIDLLKYVKPYILTLEELDQTLVANGFIINNENNVVIDKQLYNDLTSSTPTKKNNAEKTDKATEKSSNSNRKNTVPSGAKKAHEIKPTTSKPNVSKPKVSKSKEISKPKDDVAEEQWD